MVGFLADFPYNVKADGSCEMLQDNKCLVYETRPSICRVDEQIKLSGMGKRKGYRESYKVCNELMDMFNVDKSYRIKY